ncbi:hexokinase type 2-like [Bacillus rossius redtenbacheri]|uniref:hexokinase type 2-like n=1 Tax=Bacillus rossius redtenbacheri TaxID=93214 RepID=UPI002FDEDC9A
MGNLCGGKKKQTTHLDKVKKELNGIILTDDQLRRHSQEFLKQINLGLAKKTNAEADVKCFPTYVQDLPDGSERGKFLALDLGGTNFRVLVIDLGENFLFRMKSRIYVLPPELTLGTAVQLNDHIAACLSDFIHRHSIASSKLPLGYTFSFPVQQHGLTKGILTNWTKGFNVSGFAGHDVVQLLKDAISRRGDIDIDIVAILNDTTGTLMSCAWRYTNCKVGLIVGTGCNACYVERTENVELFTGDRSKPYMIVNTEMGALGESGGLDYLLTDYDLAVDKTSLYPGKQKGEKMMSGLFLSEVIRRILVDMVEKKLLLNGEMPEKLLHKDAVQTHYMSDIEASKEKGSQKDCERLLKDLGARTVTKQDCEVVAYVCELVAMRSAHLAGSAISTIINKMGFKDVTVGVDGSVYRYHPHYHDYMMSVMTKMIDKGTKFEMVLSNDGSGRGAAIVAAVAAKEHGH